jgi:alginate O-acetyltransferase complex protein AlgI
MKFFMYVSLYTQLVAGPIVRYADVALEVNNRRENLEDIWSGTARFLVGLTKKVFIANTAGQFAETYLSGDLTTRSTAAVWFGVLMFSIQIYYDFSGYSDMAIGLGRIFGFTFLENFDFPFVSKSITEFWRRWHMSLGSWFRDYVYIPLGGNRVKTPRFLFNIFVVWFLTGFWHGADWQFIVWGLFYGVMLVIEKMWLKKYLDKAPAFLCHIYVLFLSAIGFVIFNSVNMTGAVEDLKGMFGLSGLPLFGTETFYYLKSFALMFVAGSLLATPVIKNLLAKIEATKTGGKVFAIFRPIGFAAILILVTGYLADGSFNPFLYFRF